MKKPSCGEVGGKKSGVHRPSCALIWTLLICTLSVVTASSPFPGVSCCWLQAPAVCVSVRLPRVCLYVQYVCVCMCVQSLCQQTLYLHTPVLDKWGSNSLCRYKNLLLLKTASFQLQLCSSNLCIPRWFLVKSLKSAAQLAVWDSLYPHSCNTGYYCIQ